MHNHTIPTSYKPMLTQAQCAPTPVAQSLNFRDRMAWFHKQSAATGSCADDEVITRGGPQRKTGHNVGHICNGRKNDKPGRTIELPCPGVCGEVGIVPVFPEPCRIAVAVTLTPAPRRAEWLQCYLWSSVCLPSPTQLQRGHLAAAHRRLTNRENSRTLSERAALANNSRFE